MALSGRYTFIFYTLTCENCGLGLTALTQYRKIGGMTTVASPTMHEALAANLRRELEVRGMTQTKLAQECGWPPARITEILQGRFDIRLGTVEKIAKALGIPATHLLTPLSAVPS